MPQATHNDTDYQALQRRLDNIPGWTPSIPPAQYAIDNRARDALTQVAYAEIRAVWPEEFGRPISPLAMSMVVRQLSEDGGGTC